jgi:TolB-like protein/DNA-binding winged helix-turn-helix (wHTH) protein
MVHGEYRIGRFTLQPFRQLLEGETPVTIGRKALEMLSVLAAAKGGLVTKDELMTQVWPDQVVGENALQVHIAALRKLLGPDGALLTTVHGFGYRLSATEVADTAPELPMSRVDAVSGQGEEAGQMHRLRAFVLGAAAVVALIGGAAWLLSPASHPGASNIAAVSSAALPSPTGTSIAVLPFLNLSPDKDQEFFSDGMTEELTSALARVPGLTVIGRTSAFQFKGQNRDMRAIGRALGVKNLIEGSVRRDGEEVRITVQLIRADNGAHLWADSYDRKLRGIFAVQEDIATAIAAALRVPLGLKQGESLVYNSTIDAGTYEEYLRAVALIRARKTDDAIAVLKAVLAREPNYAPAWALLGEAYILPSSFARVEDMIASGSRDEARRMLGAQYALIEQAARRAIQLDPRNALAYVALGGLEDHRGHWAASEDYQRQALALDPSNPDVLYANGYLLAATGRLKQALAVQKKLMALEPFVPVYQSRTADLLWALGQNDAAMALLQSMRPDNRDEVRLAKVYATAGRFGQASDTLLATKPAPVDSRVALDQAAKLLRSAPAKAPQPDRLPPLSRDLSFVYLFVGAQSRSLEVIEREMAAGYYGGVFRDPWAPPSAALRKTDDFKAFVRQAGFDTYWRQRGWPQYCRPAGAADFACS